MSPDGGLTGVWTAVGTIVASGGTMKLSGEIGGKLYHSEGLIEEIEQGSVFTEAYEAGRIRAYTTAIVATYRFA